MIINHEYFVPFLSRPCLTTHNKTQTSNTGPPLSFHLCLRRKGSVPSEAPVSRVVFCKVVSPSLPFGGQGRFLTLHPFTRLFIGSSLRSPLASHIQALPFPSRRPSQGGRAPVCVFYWLAPPWLSLTFPFISPFRHPSRPSLPFPPKGRREERL